MNVMTDCRGWGRRGGKWMTEGVWALCLVTLLAGCDKQAVEQAQQEAREAKAAVQQLKHSLGLAQKEIASTKAELNAVTQSRDELQGRIGQITRERDEAREDAQKAQESLRARSSGQASATASLQQKIVELNALVAEQQNLIDQLQKSAGAEPAVPPTEPVPAAEPNEE